MDAPIAIDAASPPRYDSARRPPAAVEELVELWHARRLVVQLVIRDIKVRYKRSFLGVLWMFLTPLLMMLILTVVFSHAFRLMLHNYPVHVLSALMAWNFFAHGTSDAMTQLTQGGSLLNRIYVPRTLIPVCALSGALVNLVLTLVPLAIIMAWTGAPFRPAIFMIVPAIALLFVFGLGVALLVSAFAVRFHDVVNMHRVAMSMWYFLTPVIYPASLLPEKYRAWTRWNPMAHLVELFRAPLYEGRVPGFDSYAWAAGFAAASLVAGWLVFTSRADEVAYHV